MNSENALIKDNALDTLDAVIGSLGHITQSLILMDERIAEFEAQGGDLAILCRELNIKQIKGLSSLTECAMTAVEEGYGQLLKERSAYDTLAKQPKVQSSANN